WKFLEQPEAKQYVESAETVHELFADERLDLWTHLMLQVIGKLNADWTRPAAATAISIPKEKKVLPKVELHGCDILVPIEDEDWPGDHWYNVKAFGFIRDTSPFEETFKDTWVPGEDMEGYVLSKVGKMWPRVNVHWNDRYSDRAIELLAFYGLGQHMVEKLPEAHDDGSYYVIIMNFMDVLDVRPGYAKYGADAFYDSEGKVIKIVRQGETYRPGDAGWEYAKMCFRGSLLSKVTNFDHLLGIHMIVANRLVTSSREQLGPNHPLRRLLKPFTFRSVAINYGASYGLFMPRGFLQRSCALSDKGMQQTWEIGQANFRFEPFPELKARQNIDTITLPFHEDGMDYWNMVRNFVSDYIDLYFKSEEELNEDADIKDFWAYLKITLPNNMIRDLSLDNLKDLVAHAIFHVSAIHNQVGTIAEYTSDPAFCPTAWVEGELAGRPGTSVRQGLLLSLAGSAQPSIKEDFSHVMLDDEAKAVCKKFTAEVNAFPPVVKERNTRRKQAYQTFNPDTMEMAVSI
ncbi:hypothetical protein THRCLA_04011, partial [Thraustotheca clavata]